MDTLFLGLKVKIFRCSNLDTGNGTFDFVSEHPLDRALELSRVNDFEFVILDLEDIEYEDDIILDMISNCRDRSVLIFMVSKETVDKLLFDYDDDLVDCKTLKKMFTVVKKITEQNMDSKDKREELFYSLLRHDLLNKVRLVKGDIQLLRYECELSSRAEERLQKIEKIIDNSVELIGNVHTYQKIVEEKPRPVDPRSSLQRVLDSKEDLLSDEAFEVKVDFQEDCSVTGGPLIKKIYSNIIENVVKHSDGDRIMISSERKDDSFLVSIEDNGNGVPERMKSKIFEKGFTTAGEDGTGLGLYLVEEIMDVYGGKVDVKGSELGGARFDLFFEYT